jgi:hypothetical protein
MLTTQQTGTNLVSNAGTFIKSGTGIIPLLPLAMP